MSLPSEAWSVEAMADLHLPAEARHGLIRKAEAISMDERPLQSVPLADCVTSRGAIAIRSILIGTGSSSQNPYDSGGSVLATDCDLIDLHAVGALTRIIPRETQQPPPNPQLTLF